MSATPVRPPRLRNADPPELHLAAVAFSYPVSEGLLDFREASSFLAHAAIRLNALADDIPHDNFLNLLARLDRTIGLSILEIEVKAADEIRAWLRLCVERRLTCPITILEVALGINDRYGGVLPIRCVSYLVAIEVRNA